MNKNSSNIIKEVLLAFAMGIIFLAVLIGFPMLIAYITYYARKILNKIK